MVAVAYFGLENSEADTRKKKNSYLTHCYDIPGAWVFEIRIK